MKYPDIKFEPFFTWSNRPKIIYSPGVRSEVGFEMGELGGTKTVIFTDKGIVAAGVCELVAEEIRASDLELVGIFDDIVQDARIDIINKGAAFYWEKGADCLIAVGGGSVMDTAKAINILIGRREDDFQPLADQAGLYEKTKPLPPHIAFPTTAGTGCEVTSSLVVLDTKAGVKLAVTHPCANCDLAMLDPELTATLPAKITAFTGMDALTHAIESLTATSAEPIADALALHAIRLIFKHLPVVIKEPQNIDSRGNMLLASTMASMAFGNTMLGGVHAAAHALGALYEIPHGLANGIMLPEVMQFNLEEVPERFMIIADAMGLDISKKTPLEAGKEAVQAVHDLRKVIGLTETLADLGVPNDKEKLLPLVELAAADSQIAYNPRYLEEEDILDLFLKAF